MTNDEIRALPVVFPDDLERQHVCVPVSDLVRILRESDELRRMSKRAREVLDMAIGNGN